MVHRCNECGREMTKVNDIELRGFLVRGWRCKCGNVHTLGEDVDAIVKYFKSVKKGLSAKVFKSGNSVAVRLPKSVVELFRLSSKDKLLVETKKDEIILKLPGT